MSGGACKAALCHTNLAATSHTIVDRLDDFDEDQLEKMIAVAEKANHDLTDIATADDD